MAERRALAERALTLLQDALREADPEDFASESLRARVQSNNGAADSNDASLWQREVAHLEEALENERAQVQRLKRKLAIAESGPENFTSREVNYWRDRAERFDAETREYKLRIAELRRQLQNQLQNHAERGLADMWYDDVRPSENGASSKASSSPEQAAEIEALKSENQRLEDMISTVQLERDSTSGELHRLQKELAEHEESKTKFQQEASQIQSEAEEFKQEIERLRSQISDNEESKTKFQQEASQIQSEAEEFKQEAERLRSQTNSLENELSEVMSRADDAERKRDELSAKIGELEQTTADASEQIGGLEEELKEEKECTAKLSELANERREAIARLEGELEEAQERTEEAEWKLQKHGFLERVLKRRTKLISSLIEVIRAKTTANNALKAGMDSLRKFKGVSENRQRQLANQVEVLTNQLDALKKRISEQKSNPAMSAEAVGEDSAAITQLQTRLGDQTEVIASLEEELQQVKASRQANDVKQSEMDNLRKELEAKQAMIEQLENDVEEQQRRLSKLRGSESETQRLKIISDKDKNLIKSLERENYQLREALTRKEEKDGSSGEGSTSDLIAKLKERDNSVAQLLGTIKQQETAMAELTESAEQWKKKYEFVSASTNPAYEAQ